MPRKQDQAPYQAQTESAHLFAFSGENLEFKPGETCETEMAENTRRFY